MSNVYYRVRVHLSVCLSESCYLRARVNIPDVARQLVPRS